MKMTIELTEKQIKEAISESFKKSGQNISVKPENIQITTEIVGTTYQVTNLKLVLNDD